MKYEREFQPKVIEKVKMRFPGCIVLKNDPTYIQGIPDLLILFKNKWAMLETKRDKDAPFRPNQAHYIHVLNLMSYASVVYPDNLEEVLDDLQQAFES